MKKCNRKGFTLVELIVVSIMFGIIMTAILNIIKPVNKVYSDNEATMQTNMTSSALTSYLDKNLKFSTNVLVLKDYVGVPKVNLDGTLTTGGVVYTHCIVVDNNNIRGSNEAGYVDGADTPQSRMGATGCVFRVTDLDSTGFDLTNSSVALGVDFYDKFKYEISTELFVANDQSNINISVKTFEPSLNSSGSYVFTKSKFSAKSSTNLVNVNMSVSDSYVADGVDFSIAPDYATYPKATAPVSLTDTHQTAYYGTDASNTYTYIFYTKEVV